MCFQGAGNMARNESFGNRGLGQWWGEEEQVRGLVSGSRLRQNVMGWGRVGNLLTLGSVSSRSGG